MKTWQNRTLAALAAAAVLVAGANVAAYAANGRPLILGGRNTESRPTVVKNTGHGPALRLVTDPTGGAPLSVSSGVRVDRLNVDRVDGYDALDLATTSQRFTIPEDTTTASLALDLPQVGPGFYDVSFWVIGQMTAADAILNCYLAIGNGPYALLAYGVANGTYSTSTGSGSFAVPPGGTVRFRCYTSAGQALLDPGGDAAARSHVVFTKVDSLDEDPGTPPETMRVPAAAPGVR